MSRVLSFKPILIVVLFFLQSVALSVTTKKAQAAEENVEIYSEASFDSKVVEVIQPGVSYPISEKPQGPFYKIRLKNGKIGYVPDTQLDIEGVGKFVPKAYVGDEDNSNAQKKSKNKSVPEEDEEEIEDEEEKLSFHAITLQLINYHEDTLGGVQVGDLLAVGYRRLPELYDYASSFAWDIALAFGAPKYYEEKTGQSASGFGLWSGFQILNITPFGSDMTLRYGAGPFMKLTQFNVQTVNKKYTLQDMTLGLTLEGGMIFHFNAMSLDLGLRYYWDKNSYGSIGLGVLF